ncbi:MAG: hypothetical protein LBC20_09065 [Planctomycetaceae bacterium]|nr:hypothetical protein [Planctomycetaceae bacterium]
MTQMTADSFLVTIHDNKTDVSPKYCINVLADLFLFTYCNCNNMSPKLLQLPINCCGVSAKR